MDLDGFEFRPIVDGRRSFRFGAEFLVQIFDQRRTVIQHKPDRTVDDRPQEDRVDHARGEYVGKHARRITRGEDLDGQIRKRDIVEAGDDRR